MTALELKRTYEKLPESERLLAATLIAADQMLRGSEYRARVEGGAPGDKRGQEVAPC